MTETKVRGIYVPKIDGDGCVIKIEEEFGGYSDEKDAEILFEIFKKHLPLPTFIMLGKKFAEWEETSKQRSQRIKEFHNTLKNGGKA